MELARDIAGKFNNDFQTEFFPITEPVIMGVATRVMSLRDGKKKMSKSEESDYSRINLTDSKDEIVNKIKKAKTDSLPLPGAECLNKNNNFNDEIIEDRPEAVNLLNIFSSLSGKPLSKVVDIYSGKQFSYFKDELSALASDILSPVNNEMKKLLEDKIYMGKVLKDGKERAEQISNPIIYEVKKIIGYL